MIPVGDSGPTRRIPYVNWALIGINLLVFLYELTLPGRQLDRLFTSYGVMPNHIFSAFANPAQTSPAIWLTLITSQFLHSGWAHIIGNMLFLWVFGDNIEDVLGHFVYLFFYLTSGVLAGLAQAFVSGPIDIPSIGASGAIAGVLGGYILLYPLARVRVLFLVYFIGTIQLPALIVIGWWFLQQFFYGVGALSAATEGGVAFWAHIGGFVAGLILILPFIGRARRHPAAVFRSEAPSDNYNRRF